ncbi:AAA family ATPase [Mycolicibacterium palauense]|uniref:AAA family ATPase n=1 Tax=Mycolicibacterium palauense TaxID=2034511 RepID=UPI00159B86C8|nr:AAA family ATPase [Mycolicibacterium palauense]
MGRSAESRILAGFLDPGRTDASALFIEGDAGIGKTTLWLDGLRLARERGFTVLAAQPAPAESTLDHGVLTDLLDQAYPASGEAWTSLRASQRLALERIVHADEPARGEDARAVAAGFLALIRALAVDAPVLIAIDDVQWSDPSSREALAFAARRVAGPVSLLVTERTTPQAAPARTRLRLLQPEATRTLEVGPLSLGGLHAVLRERLRRSFPRPTMARIAEASGGNPFYALELGRAMLGGGAGDAAADAVPLPGTLIELVAARLDALAPESHPPLLAVACLGAPTLSTVARAAETDPGGRRPAAGAGRGPGHRGHRGEPGPVL